jgi:hypothetical protein
MVESVNQGIGNPGQTRGVFGPRRRSRGSSYSGVRDVIDGTSNTVVMSERLCQENIRRARGSNCDSPPIAGAKEVEHTLGVAVDVDGLIDQPALCYTASDGQYFVAGHAIQHRFGWSWKDAQSMYIGFNTVLPPNAPACAQPGQRCGDFVNLVMPPASRHTGGVVALMGDGAVRFISDSIDTGDLGVRQNLTGPSMYGVWGSLGSKNGSDIVSNF